MTYKNHEYERYIHSKEWRDKADARLAMDNHICQVCGETASDVHHLTYDRFGHEDFGDLVSLCRKCHQKAEEIYIAPALSLGRWRKQSPAATISWQLCVPMQWQLLPWCLTG